MTDKDMGHRFEVAVFSDAHAFGQFKAWMKLARNPVEIATMAAFLDCPGGRTVFWGPGRSPEHQWERRFRQDFRVKALGLGAAVHSGEAVGGGDSLQREIRGLRAKANERLQSMMEKDAAYEELLERSRRQREENRNIVKVLHGQVASLKAKLGRIQHRLPWSTRSPMGRERVKR